MAHPDKRPAHIRLDERNHVEKLLLDGPWALRPEEPRRG